MYVDFSTLPDTSRVWIYQSNRNFIPTEIEKLKQQLHKFTELWVVHGNLLEASFLIKYNRFIILAINQETQQISGCSIDSSVYFIQELEKEYHVDLLDKMNVSYRHGEYIAYKSLSDFRKMAKNRSVSLETIVFNNLVTNKAEFETSWEVPAKDSWHNRFF